MRNNNSKEKNLEEYIIDLYLNLKPRLKENNFPKIEDREKLRKTNPRIILEYVKSSIDILINISVKEKLEKISEDNEDLILNDTEVNQYEKQLRQAESQIRSHIKANIYYI